MHVTYYFPASIIQGIIDVIVNNVIDYLYDCLFNDLFELLANSLLNVQKYSNSLAQHRRTRNLNVPLPQLNILLPLAFLHHLINRVPNEVYININKYCCTLHLEPGLFNDAKMREEVKY